MSEDTVKYMIVVTTCPNEETASNITECLLNEKLAACVQVSAIKSCYTWKGKVEKEDELLLHIKAKADLYKEVEKTIKENHPYEVPEIIQIPVTRGYKPYLDWIDEVSV